MSKLVQCIPNFSTQREEDGAAIASAIAAGGNVQVLDRHWDADHARTVVTFVGPPQEVRKALLAGSAKAIELVDLRVHKGKHPRIGAADVVPLVPLQGVCVEECVRLSHDMGVDLAEKLKLPVYFYEQSARLSHRVNLADVRKGGFEALRRSGLQGKWKPDLGPEEIHPTAGACVIGCRGPLIAFNVNLDTHDAAVAKSIARKIRETRDAGQGLPGVKAIGLSLPSHGCVQVSTNITLPDEVTMYDVLSFVEREAEALGVKVKEAELVGMIRRTHFEAAASKSPLIDRAVRAEAVIENRIAFTAGTLNS